MVSRAPLTIAQLDQGPSNNDTANLAALCQYFHIRLKAPTHRKHSAKTRRRGMNNLRFFENLR